MRVADLSLEEIAKALGGKVKRSGKRQYVAAPAPGHSRKDESLTVELIPGASEGWLVNGFAGEDGIALRDYVREKCGADPFQPGNNGAARSNGKSHAPKPASTYKPSAEDLAANAKVRAAMDKKPAGEARRLVKTYPYHNADGSLAYSVLRYEPKSFSQRGPNGETTLDGIARVPFRLPEMVEDNPSTIFYTEGEKDSESLADLHLCATTLSGGTNWTPELAEYFRGRDVVILPDFNDVGADKRKLATDALYGVAASIRVVYLPDLTGGEKRTDVTDWLALDAKNSERLVDVCLARPIWAPGDEIEGEAAARAVKTKKESADAATAEPLLPLGEWDAGDDLGPIPPRGWLLGNIFCRRFVSSLIADGGVGKTALRVAQLLSLATGRKLTGEHIFMRCRVLIVSLEDDTYELRRRLEAAMLHFGIERKDVKGWLFMVAPGSTDKIMAMDQHGRSVIGNLTARVTQTVINRRIDVVALDPFVKTHAVPENDNNLIDGVVQMLADLAVKHDIAVDTPHHVSKGPADPGNANRGRGASAAKDAWRLVYTLSAMTPDEAKAFSLSEAERRKLIRMDSAKVNIVPMTDAKWFRLVGVNIGNGTDLYPSGDDVQTVEPWTPPDTFSGLDNKALNHILSHIDRGLPDGNRFTDAPKATDRAAWRVIENYCPGKSEASCRQIIKLWVDSGLLTKKDYLNPATRKAVSGLHVDNSKRPG